jgi:hypothetical protein
MLYKRNTCFEVTSGLPTVNNSFQEMENEEEID